MTKMITFAYDLDGSTSPRDEKLIFLSFRSSDGLHLVTGNYFSDLKYTAFDQNEAALKAKIASFGVKGAVTKSLTTAQYSGILLAAGETVSITYHYKNVNTGNNDYAFAIFGTSLADSQSRVLSSSAKVKAEGRTNDTVYSTSFTTTHAGFYSLLIGNADGGTKLNQSDLVINSITLTEKTSDVTYKPNGLQLTNGGTILANGDFLNPDGTIQAGKFSGGTQALLNNQLNRDGAGLVAAGGGNLVAAGGGNLIAAGGGNLISQDGGGLIAAGGGNLISQDGAGIAATNSGAGLVAAGGGNFTVTTRAFQSVPDVTPPVQPLTAPRGFGGDLLIGEAGAVGTNQNDPAVAALASGKFVVAWSSFNDSTGHFELRAQLRGADGSSAGSSFLVSTATSSDQYEASVTGLPSGKFVVSWLGKSLDASGLRTAPDIHFQLYDAAGAKVGTEQRVGFTVNELGPKLASLSNGDFVLTFEAQDSGQAGSSAVAFRYKADGTFVSSVGLGDTASNTAVKSAVAAAGLPGGGFAAVYREQKSGAADPDGIYLDIVKADGTRAFSEILVNTTKAGTQNTPTIATLANGNLAIAWTDDGASPAPGLAALRVQLVDSHTGKLIGSEVVVANTLADGDPPSIAALSDGRFTVAWNAPSIHNGTITGLQLNARTFNSDLTGESKIVAIGTPSPTDAYREQAPALTQLANGTLVAIGRYGDGRTSTIQGNLLSVGTTAPSFPNLIVNGNFEKGNTGFTSDYTLVAADHTVFTGPGQYAVIKNPAADFTNGYDSYGDHTSGSGRMLFFDGTTGGAIWKQTVKLAANTSYTFSFYASGGTSANNPTLALSLDGTALDAGRSIAAHSGTWQSVTYTFTATAGSHTLALSDLRGDSYGNDAAIDDIALTVSPVRSVGFAAPKTVTVGTNPTAVVAADLDGDGKIDLAVSNKDGGSVSVLKGAGNGSFTTGQTIGDGGGPNDLAIGDFNGDGRTDLVTSNYSGNGAVVLLAQSDGTFKVSHQSPLAAGNNPFSVTAADVDGDGKLDLLIGNSGAYSLSYYKGKGDGTFVQQPDIQRGTSPDGAAVGDLNGDKRADLVVSNYNDDTATVLLQNADGSFTAQTPVAVGDNPSHQTLADLNGDGKLDLVVSNYADGTVSVLLGKGDGTFGTQTRIGIGLNAQEIAVGDLNGDGKLDIAVADSGSGTVAVLLGRGDGTFIAQAPIKVGNGPVGLTLSDLNGDGALDIVATNTADGTVSVLLNATPLAIPLGPSTVLTTGLDRIGFVSGTNTVTATVATLNPGDVVIGGSGLDTLVLQGGGSFDFAKFPKVTGFEQIDLAKGGDYTLTLNDGFVPAGKTLTIDGHGLGAADDLTFNGAAETNGSFVVIGGAGADRMTGGHGNDTFYVGSGDTVFEAKGGGTDTVVASTSYALAAGQEIENLQTASLTGTAPINLTGNEFAQTVRGNAGANILDGKGGADSLYGYGGNDTYVVDNAADKVFEGAGQGTADKVVASVSYTLAAGQQIETLQTRDASATTAINLTGNEFAQTIQGNAGTNILRGGGGGDSMYGYGGNDTYYVSASTDRVFEAVGQGADKVLTYISYALAAGQSIESLATAHDTSTSAINLTGNEQAQSIRGSAGANVLDGGLGSDTLTGLGGADTFVFKTTIGPNNVDHITDFVTSATAVHDTIALSKGIFGALAATGSLAATAFKDLGVAGAKVDGDDRILYDHTTGVLSYDADGSGTKAAAVQFAVLDNKATLTFQDFHVIL